MENRIGFGPRLGAYLLDIVFALGLTFIILKLAPSFLENLINWDAMSDEEYEGMQMILKGSTDALLAFSTGFPIIYILYGLSEGLFGQTPGKALLGLKIGTIEGKLSTMNQLMIRFLIKKSGFLIGLISIAVTLKIIDYTSTIALIIILIGCFFVLGEAKLSFHDMIAKTAIFKKTEIGSTIE